MTQKINKIIYILTVVSLCLVFFGFGWFLHKPVKSNVIATNAAHMPDFSQNQPYLPFIYDLCPTTNIPDEQACATELFYSTQKEAGLLADKLSQKSNDLRTKIKVVLESINNYIQNYCSLDGTLISGGTGELREIAACQYYYEKQYLDLLKNLDNNM